MIIGMINIINNILYHINKNRDSVKLNLKVNSTVNDIQLHFICQLFWVTQTSVNSSHQTQPWAHESTHYHYDYDHGDGDQLELQVQLQGLP